MEQSQEEFYFSLPLDKFDVCLFGLDHNASTEQVAEGIGLTEELVTRVYGQIESKRMATRYLHLTPLLAGEER